MLLFWALLCCVAQADYDYGARASHYVEPALKLLAAEVPQCLPREVSAQMASWLQRMNVLGQYRLLYAVGVQRLIRDMEAGQPLCAAVPSALKRMYGRHQHSLAQRLAMEIAPEEGGWSETAQQMRDALESAAVQCHRAEREAAMQNETRWPERRAVLNCLKRVEKESKKVVVVYHWE